jgi:hypothetical protein
MCLNKNALLKNHYLMAAAATLPFSGIGKFDALHYQPIRHTLHMFIGKYK